MPARARAGPSRCSSDQAAGAVTVEEHGVRTRGEKGKRRTADAASGEWFTAGSPGKTSGAADAGAAVSGSGPACEPVLAAILFEPAVRADRIGTSPQVLTGETAIVRRRRRNPPGNAQANGPGEAGWLWRVTVSGGPPKGPDGARAASNLSGFRTEGRRACASLPFVIVRGTPGKRGQHATAYPTL